MGPIHSYSPWFDFFPLQSLFTLLPILLKNLGQVCCLPEIPCFYGRPVAQYQALGSRQGIWPEWVIKEHLKDPSSYLSPGRVPRHFCWPEVPSSQPPDRVPAQLFWQRAPSWSGVAGRHTFPGSNFGSTYSWSWDSLVDYKLWTALYLLFLDLLPAFGWGILFSIYGLIAEQILDCFRHREVRDGCDLGELGNWLWLDNLCPCRLHLWFFNNTLCHQFCLCQRGGQSVVDLERSFFFLFSVQFWFPGKNKYILEKTVYLTC